MCQNIYIKFDKNYWSNSINSNKIACFMISLISVSTIVLTLMGKRKLVTLRLWFVAFVYCLSWFVFSFLTVSLVGYVLCGYSWTSSRLHFLHFVDRPSAVPLCSSFLVCILVTTTVPLCCCILSLFVHHLLFRYPGKAVRRDCRLSRVPLFIFLFLCALQVVNCSFTFKGITNTCLYNFNHLKPHFYIIKLGFTGAVLTSTTIYVFEQKYEKNLELLSENFQCLVVKFSIYLIRRIFVMFALK